MPTAIVSDLQVSINGSPLDAQQDLPVLCGVDVDLGVQMQGMIKLELAVGQDASGDWARRAAHQFIPGSPISAEVRIGDSKRRLINGLLTKTSLNFSADIHDSKFEVTGMDALEKVKRSHNPKAKYQGDLVSIVSQVLDRQNIPLNSRKTPIVSNISESQTDSDLDFLTNLARKYNCEIYVESDDSGDNGYFQKLDFDAADLAKSLSDKKDLEDLRINQGLQSNVRNVQFSIDVSGVTRVEANNLDSNGKASEQKIVSDLRDTPNLSQIESDLLGPVSFAVISRLNREGKTSPGDLQTRCDSELEKNAWVVVGKGELDTAAYGAVLYPRRTLNVLGAGSLFDGTYMVWKVTHSFKRDVHCQRFELRRKLGMMKNGGS
jgi:phage protein D